MPSSREIGYALLRVTLGVLFATYGIGKFRMGVGNFAGMMEKEFTGKLPMVMVSPFGYLVPFAELLVGVLLTFGLFTLLALTLAGLLMIALTFGMALLGQAPVVAQNLTYVLAIFVLLWTAENNGYSLDRLRQGR
ncbi:MAG: DoxX family membrane protein [Acidobacteriia bacterium]|nr:DoxX family membrane protein [Terriglobia bacterium]